MKHFKKMIALVIAMVMIVGTMSMAALAAGDLTPDSKITINGLDAGDEVHLYQVLTWVDGDGWTIKPGYEALVTQADGNDNYSSTVAKLVQGSNSEAVTLEKADLEKIANVVKAAANATGNAKVSPVDEKTLTESPYTYSTTQAPGMYIALVTPGTAGVIYNPIVVSADFSKTPDTSVIDASKAKMGTSSVAKKENITVNKTSEEEDAANNTTDDGESDGTDNSHDVGDIVKFTVTTQIPAYSDSFVNPSFKVSDSLTNGLEMVVDNDHPFTIVNGIATADGYTAPTTGATSWTVEFDSDAIAELVTYADVEITYYAKITNAAISNVNEAENTVEVEFSNNPNDDGDKGKLKDKTKHYTFTLDGNLLGGKGYKNSELVKVGVDKDGNPIESVIKESSGYEAAALAGAKFGLFITEDAAGSYTGNGSDITDANAAAKGLYTNDVFKGIVESDAQGLMFINGLDEGTYYLKELDAPDGYIRDLTVYTITIDATIETETVHETIDGYDVSYDVPVLKSYTVTVNPGGTSSFSTTITGSDILESTTKGDTPTSIKNTKGVELPSTGGIGTTIFYVIGAILVLGAGVLLVTRRRMSEN